MAPLLFLPRKASWLLLFAKTDFSCELVRRFFDSSVDAARETICWASLQWRIRRLPAVLDFCFGQFSFFSTQIDGVDDFISFTVHPTIRKQFLARVWSNQKSA